MEFINPDDSDNNIQDDRGKSGGKKMALGGIGTVIVVVIALFLGKSPTQLLNQVNNVIPSSQTQSNEDYKPTEEEQSLVEFEKKVFHSCEYVWASQMKQMGQRYQDPILVFYTDQHATACGTGQAAMGPFYCPGDQKIYLDVSFFDEMRNQLHADGEFAQAYVVAHEFGHHIQNLLGTTQKLDAARGQVSDKEYNKLSVKLELQADFLAGYWAHYAQQGGKGIKLNEKDVDDALNAASQIGDDKLQKQAQGYVVPDAFTHGTSAQRVYWFKKGLETGDIKQGDTFNDPSLN